MNRYVLRKIEKDEIKRAAEILAENFKDYPIYHAFFPKDETREKYLTVFYNASLRSRKNYTYVTDDLSFIGCIKRPTDKTGSVFTTYLNPKYFFRCLPFIRPKYVKLFRSYVKNCESLRKDNYDEKKDVFVEAVCIDKERRIDVSFFELFKDNYKNETIYAETADERLIRLYKMIGFDVIDQTVWQDVNNYALKKIGATDVSTRREENDKA